MTKLPYGLSDFKRVLEENEKNYTTNLEKINSILDKYKDVKMGGLNFAISKKSLFKTDRYKSESLNLLRELDLVIFDTKQRVLTANFIYDFFYAIDDVDFVDTLGVKYFTYDKRNDRVNIYISNKIKNDLTLSKELFGIINTLIILKHIKNYFNIKIF